MFYISINYYTAIVNLNWIVMVILFGFIQAFITIYLLFKNGAYSQNKFIIWFIAILMLFQIESFLLKSELINKVPHLLNFSKSFIFILGPLLLFYTKSKFGETLRKKDLFHFSPFVFYFLYNFNFYIQPKAYKLNIITKLYFNNNDLLPVEKIYLVDPWNIQGWIVVELITLHILLYSVACLYVLYKIKKEKSSIKSTIETWLLYLISLFAIGGFVLFFSEGGIINDKVFLKTPFSKYSPDIFSTLMIYLIMLYLIIMPKTIKNKGIKYEKSSLSKEFKKEKLKRIEQIFNQNKVYKSQSFSMKTLSEKSGLTSHHISQILNEEMGCTFFELLNKYRIQDAKKILKQNSGFNKIEQLAFDLGYKSKSTFYKAFKKETGKTPLQYRKDLL